jgi:tetratricopeptide (TPR) repeat protein
VEVGGDTPEFHLLMGKAALNRNDDEKATPELERAAAANPKLPFVHLYLGIAYVRLNEHDAARAEFEKQITLEPDAAEGYDELGALYAVQRDDQNAARYFRLALARDARLARSQFGLADVLQRQGKLKESLAALDAAERLATDSRNVHYLRGRVLKRLGRGADAKKEFDEAQRLADKGLARDEQILRDKITPEPELMNTPE